LKPKRCLLDDLAQRATGLAELHDLRDLRLAGLKRSADVARPDHRIVIADRLGKLFQTERFDTVSL